MWSMCKDQQITKAGVDGGELPAQRWREEFEALETALKPKL